MLQKGKLRGTIIMKTKSRFTLGFSLGLRSAAASALALSLVVALPGLAQDANQSAPPPAPSATAPAAPNPSGGWRKFQPLDQTAPDQSAQGAPSAVDPSGNPAPPPAPPAPGDPQNTSQAPPLQQPYPPQGQYPAQQQYPPQGQYPAQQPYPPQGQYPAQQQYPPQGQYPAPPPIPASITLPVGTWVTVRVNEPLSSDKNQTGDAFTGTLLEPIIANGLLIARRGETVTGMVTEAQKAGRVSGVSHLKLELTGIQLADGRQIQVKTQLIDRRGNTSYGRDALGIGATTAAGAAIGAGVNGGVGAGVGAAAGLVVSTIGVLLTRGRATVVSPETSLTFSTQTPIALDNSQQTFHYASQYDYNARVAPAGSRSGYGSAYGRPYPYAAPPPYYGGYYAPYPYAYGYPYPYYGPSLFLGFGGRWGYGGRWR
jgi:hypothetical protein